MKKIIFVSSGRCGTKKIYELLKYKELDAEVKHQMPLSRTANVVGNIMFLFGESEMIKQKLYLYIVKRYSRKKMFVSSDPLTAMIIPQDLIQDPDTMIVHIVRKDIDFASSIFKISRNRFKSFIAHNFIPFWQIGLLPMENLLNKKIINKYCIINKIKNDYFYKRYSCNPNYVQVKMEDFFKKDLLSHLIKNFSGEGVVFTKEELSVKSNL